MGLGSASRCVVAQADHFKTEISIERSFSECQQIMFMMS